MPTLTTTLPFTIEFVGIPNYADSIIRGTFSVSSGVFYDFTGMTFAMYVGTQRAKVNTPTYLATILQSDSDITPMSNGVIEFRFRPEKIGTIPAGSYKIDLIATLAGRQIAFAVGKLAITDRVIS